MLTKGLSKDLINKFNIINEAKKISSEIFQNFLVFISAGKYLKYFKALLGLIRRNPMECQKIKKY